MSVNEKTNYNEMMDKIMDKITNQITMLGTGNATVSQIYNTCFLLQTSSTLMLVDAGGGNGILSQLKKVNVQISDIHHLFVTHAHTDHVLGVIWVIRMVAQCKGYEGLLHVYGNDKVMRVIKTIIDMILAKKQLAKVAERVVFHQLEDGDCFEVGDMKLECFVFNLLRRSSSDSGRNCQELQKIMFQKIRLHPIMLQKIRLHPIKLHLKIMLNLWSWRVWAMSLIMSKTAATLRGRIG